MLRTCTTRKVACWQAARYPEEALLARGGSLLASEHHPSFQYTNQLKEWGDQYRRIYRLCFVGNTHIILSTQDAANDLLVKKGAIYSGRGGLTAFSEGLTRNLATLVMPPNDTVSLSTAFS